MGAPAPFGRVGALIAAGTPQCSHPAALAATSTSSFAMGRPLLVPQHSCNQHSPGVGVRCGAVAGNGHAYLWAPALQGRFVSLQKYQVGVFFGSVRFVFKDTKRNPCAGGNAPAALGVIPLLFLQVTAAVLIPGGMVAPVFTLLVTGLLEKSLYLCSSSNLGQNSAQYTVCGPAGQLYQSPIATEEQGCVFFLFRIPAVHSCPSSLDHNLPPGNTPHSQRGAGAGPRG